MQQQCFVVRADASEKIIQYIIIFQFVKELLCFYQIWYYLHVGAMTTTTLRWYVE